MVDQLEDTESTSSRRADDVDENNSCGDEARPATVVIDIIEPGNAVSNFIYYAVILESNRKVIENSL